MKSIENEKEVMFTDFQLLSEEVVERDLIIQSLNKVFDEKEEDVAFMLDMTSNVSVSGKPANSWFTYIYILNISYDYCKLFKVRI